MNVELFDVVESECFSCLHTGEKCQNDPEILCQGWEPKPKWPQITEDMLF